MKIGLLHPRSGVSGIWAPSLDAAAMLGAAEINARGGILGEDIELVFADCGFSVREATDAADWLLAVEGSAAVIGSHPSNLRDPVSQRVSGKTPYVYTPQYEGTACGASTLAIGSTDREVLAPALHWLRDVRQAERVFFVGNDYVWPRMAYATTRRIMSEQGGRLVGHAFLPNQTGAGTDVLRRIARSGAQLVVLALVGQCAIEFNQAFAAAGLDERILRFGLIVDETVICGIGADASNNLFTAAHYFASQRSGANDRFLERYHDAFGEWAPPVSAASVSCYEALHVVAGLAATLGSRRGADLARHLDRSAPRTAPAGRSRRVYLGQANGAAIDVVVALPG